jgi:hypothetical protein
VKLRPIGYIRSTLRDAASAPKQGTDGAPDAWIEIDPAEALTLRQGCTSAQALLCEAEIVPSM